MEISRRLHRAAAGAAICAMAVSLVAAAAPADAAGKVKLSKTNLSIAAGSKKTIKASSGSQTRLR